MYFQIENTPEHIKRARRAERVKKPAPQEEVPRLIIAPFSRPPQVVFENVILGTTCEKSLEVYNPSNQTQQITLGRALPEGLIIHLPGDYLTLDPETCYCVTMLWTPMQPTALRETIRFTNDNRGRFDIIVILKSAMNIKTKNQSKVFKTSPGKMKRKTINKRSPVTIYKKKAEVIYNTTKVKKTVVQTSVQHKTYRSSNKENISGVINSYKIESDPNKNPFDSLSGMDFNFDTSEIFSDMKRSKNTEVLQQTYETSYRSNILELPVAPQNVLKPTTRQNLDNIATDIFDNITFTPLKSVPAKNDKLDKGHRIILSVNSESDLDDSLEMAYSNKENATHSILCIASSQPPSKWLTVDQQTPFLEEASAVPNKKIPNTSSPKEFTSPNFSINTEFSRISDLSFYPQRFSTERKLIPKMINETHDLLDEKLSSNTYTKDSPNNAFPSMEYPVHHGYTETRPPAHTVQPKMCRQSLFKEMRAERNFPESSNRKVPMHETDEWQHELRVDKRSPRKSSSPPPPLQSIPEESTQFSETHIFDKSDKQSTFTINRTFDKPCERQSLSNRHSWSKKAIRAEAELWKIPIAYAKKVVKSKTVKKDDRHSKITNVTLEANQSQNLTFNHIGNVYSQALTVDPFLSSTYFYDEEAVEMFEKEFKRWLNCILTPPADLESNVEEKVDVGKAWIESRNKDVPLAPTKEQVSSTYHNSHRLKSLRRSARALLMSAEISQVFLKLNAQIEKKLIAVRSDRNLHLDIGLQKTIMELLLSYNPLWLRIGLEAIYGQVLPLKSNNDIEGLTSFIIQRMFKNPFLKNKHSKSSAPNMLLPAYMEAIKKFTLKKFFMLVFFLDQAKQKKLISHDPCLFRRNVICKESRDVIIRFTREIIAGIGDITRHLRPLGYVVSHKQSYLDEYKFGVHNIALDIRDGVRLTKVMEIILMKNGLMNQLRTPPISRLQKIHNVQVALNALKESNFVIVGDISAVDIADGHREKTLSLLWQLIHVFRAPLFEQAANVIQTWWKKKYEVIVAKREEEARILQKQINAASVIQCWWRKIQYNRLVEWKMQQITTATIVVQKYCRMWLCRTRLRKIRTSVLKIQEWYRNMILLREAKEQLRRLKSEREELRHRAVIKIQTYFRRWICIRKYEITVKRIILAQSIVRSFIIRRWFLNLRKTVIFVQEKYRGKSLMREQVRRLTKIRQSVSKIQEWYRNVLLVREAKETLQRLRLEREELRFTAAVKIQTCYRRWKCTREYQITVKKIILIQSIIRCYLIRKCYLNLRQTTIYVQKNYRAKLRMKLEMKRLAEKRTSAIKIQKWFRNILLRREAQQTLSKLRLEREELRNKAATKIQSYFRRWICVHKYEVTVTKIIIAQSAIRSFLIRKRYINIKRTTITIQRRYRGKLLMKKEIKAYDNKRKSVIKIQEWYRNILLMREAKDTLKRLRLEREELRRKSAVTIQAYYRRWSCRREYGITIKKIIKVQSMVRSFLVRKSFKKLKKTTEYVQEKYRGKLMMRKERQQFETNRCSVLKIQQWYRNIILMRQAKEYLRKLKLEREQLRVRSAITLQSYIRRWICIRNYQITLRKIVLLQSIVRSYLIRKRYILIKKAIIYVQKTYRRKLLMREDMRKFTTIRISVLKIQKWYRNILLMREARDTLNKLKVEREQLRCKAATTIQKHFRKWVCIREYKTTVKRTVIIQSLVRSYLVRKQYLRLRNTTIYLQRIYRGKLSMKEEMRKLAEKRQSARKIQEWYRNVMLMRKSKALLERLRLENNSATKIQTWYRSIVMRNECRNQYLNFRKHTISIQSVLRTYILRKQFLRIKQSTLCIQQFYRSYRVAKIERQNYIQTRESIIKVQAQIRSYITRQHFLRLRSAAITIQIAYRLKKQNDLIKKQREEAAICLQKHIRRYLAVAYYQRFRQQVIFIQKTWRSKLVTRLVRCEFLQKRRFVVNLQSLIRGYLVRKEIKCKIEQLERLKEEKKLHRAASKIQALFRGHRTRIQTGDHCVAELRRRWREGALESQQDTMKERHTEVLRVLSNVCDIDTVIRAFKSLELLTEVFPMLYNENVASVTRRVLVYMSVTNRSISSVDVLKSAASVLVNLTRYRVTGPKVYNRDIMTPILKFMWRFSNSETQLFCILCTFLWLFNKYDAAREDLCEFLHIPENHKMLTAIKGNIERMKRMSENSARNRFSTPQPNKFVSHTLNHSMRETSHSSVVLPALEPDYGIKRAHKPRYFEDTWQAINCLFRIYKL